MRLTRQSIGLGRLDAGRPSHGTGPEAPRRRHIPTQPLRAAAVQLTATPDKARNLAAADRLVRRAAADGARLVVLPEKWSVLGHGADLRAGAEPLDGPAVTWARDAARELGIDLVAGSVSERVDGEEKLRNTSLHIGPDGAVKAVYRKMHMFDVEVDGTVYRESDHEAPGDDVVLTTTADGTRVGLTVCYDVRFPELYRILAVRGRADPDHPGRLHRRRRRATTGGARPRPRDRGPVLRDRRQPGRRARRRASVRRALDDRGSVGPGPGPGRGHETVITADLDLDAQADASVLLKVHQSNFVQRGFVEQVDVGVLSPWAVASAFR